MIFTHLTKCKTPRRVPAKRLLTSRRLRVVFLGRETLRHSSAGVAILQNHPRKAVKPCPGRWYMT